MAGEAIDIGVGGTNEHSPAAVNDRKRRRVEYLTSVDRLSDLEEDIGGGAGIRVMPNLERVEQINEPIESRTQHAPPRNERVATPKDTIRSLELAIGRQKERAKRQALDLRIRGALVEPAQWLGAGRLALRGDVDDVVDDELN